MSVPRELHRPFPHLPFPNTTFCAPEAGFFATVP